MTDDNMADDAAQPSTGMHSFLAPDILAATLSDMDIDAAQPQPQRHSHS